MLNARLPPHSEIAIQSLGGSSEQKAWVGPPFTHLSTEVDVHISSILGVRATVFMSETLVDDLGQC